MDPGKIYFLGKVLDFRARYKGDPLKIEAQTGERPGFGATAAMTTDGVV